MKKNLLYVFLLLILGGLTWYFVFREEEEVFDTKEANFTVKDTGAITSLFLSNPKDGNIKLTKVNGQWVLNDSLKPRMDALTLLLATLAQQKPEQPVSISYHDDVVKDLSANHSKVEVYTAKGKTHTFYVGKNAGPNNITYMLNENAKRPYIVKLPLQNTFVGIRYFTRVSDWRDKKILYDNAPVEWVDVQYKDSTQYSFKLKLTGGPPEVTGNSHMAGPLNTATVRAYVKMLDNIYCTGFEEQFGLKDSIIHFGRQLATVKMKRMDHNPEEITFYFKPVSKGTKATLKIGVEEYDFDVFFALLDQRDFILLSRSSAEKLLRSYPEFYTNQPKS